MRFAENLNSENWSGDMADKNQSFILVVSLFLYKDYKPFDDSNIDLLGKFGYYVFPASTLIRALA